MKTLCFVFRVAATALLMLALNAGAQMAGAGPGGSAAMTAAMSKLFGDVKAFTAHADVRVLDDSQTEIANMPMEFAYLDGKMRVEVNMEQVKSSNMPADAKAQLKQMGMSEIISIVLPEEKLVHVVYPENKSIMSMKLPEAEGQQGTEKDLKIQKTPLGKETVDGHACQKNKVLIPDGKGQNIEATTWNAADLKEFPIKIETKEKQNSSIIRFSKVQLVKPESKQFELPESFTKYNSPQEFMHAMMSKTVPKQDGAK